jgi:hypothetical protein
VNNDVVPLNLSNKVETESNGLWSFEACDALREELDRKSTEVSRQDNIILNNNRCSIFFWTRFCFWDLEAGKL